MRVLPAQGGAFAAGDRLTARTRNVGLSPPLNSTTHAPGPGDVFSPGACDVSGPESADAGGPPEGFEVCQGQHLRLADGVAVLDDVDAAGVQAPAFPGSGASRRGEPAPAAVGTRPRVTVENCSRPGPSALRVGSPLKNTFMRTIAPANRTSVNAVMAGDTLGSFGRRQTVSQ